jgi:colicin import membrane protein
MASQRGKRIFAFWLSVLGHALVVVALTFSVSLSGPAEPAGLVIPIATVMVDQSALDAVAVQREADRQADLRRQEEERVRLRREEQQRQDRIEQQRVAAEEAEQQRVQLEAEAAELEAARREREAEEEAARQEAERERERLAREEAERKRVEAEAARRREEIADQVAAAAAAEQAAREAADSGLKAQWIALIGNRVQSNWQRPPNALAGLECLLVVEQQVNGVIRSIAVTECNVSDPNIIRSLENAVQASSPLPAPPRGVEFERIVRIRFKPTD